MDSVVLMLAHRLRRRPNPKPTYGQGLVHTCTGVDLVGSDAAGIFRITDFQLPSGMSHDIIPGAGIF